MNQPDFSQLTEAEQREVAERLLKIKQSDWKPFWCSDHNCTGDPHPLRRTVGRWKGKPVPASKVDDDHPSAGWYKRTTVSVDGKVTKTYRAVLDANAEHVLPDETLIGRVALDPHWAHNHARVDQRLPRWSMPWILAVLSGRGSGKTTTGVEFVTLCARKGLDGAIVGRRGTELVNTHVKTILERAHPEFVPEYFASKDILVWPNGATTFLFSAERPENIRSVNLSYWWIDEAAWMDEIETVWMNLKLATRIEKPGSPIHGLITSTPTGTPFMMRIEDDDKIELRRVSTYANRINLSKDFVGDLEREYEGTRMGRQELHGEVLRDVEGALWNDDLFKHLRINNPAAFEDLLDAMDDRVLAVDPAGSKGPRSDAHGIIAAGAMHYDEHGGYLPASNFFVLGDATLKGTPTERSAQVYKAARFFRVNRIVVEKNSGGEDVKQGLLDYAKLHPEESLDENGEQYQIVLEHAHQAKEVRAEPTVGKYEQGRVTHVTSPGIFGDLSMLEKEQIGWVPKSRGGRMPSPNRIDALVWCIRALESKVRYQTTTATSKDIMAKLKRGPRIPNRLGV
jgi:phage terminase large subunit-like protein